MDDTIPIFAQAEIAAIASVLSASTAPRLSNWSAPRATSGYCAGQPQDQDRVGPRIQIDDPTAVEDLLDLALEAAGRRQRVVFFCACEYPRQQGAPGSCHRATVAGLVLKAAGCGVPVELVEWPGGQPVFVDVPQPEAVVRKLLRGAQNVPLGKRLPAPELLGLPWASVARLAADPTPMGVITGPARFTGGQWCLPVLATTNEISLPARQLRSAVAPLRKQIGAESRTG